MSVSGTSSGTYRYDGNMKRVVNRVGGETIYNVYDSSGTLVHVDKGKTIIIPFDDLVIAARAKNETDYIRVAGTTVARVTKGEPTFLHPNHLGSAIAGTTKTGVVAWNEVYTPFGEKFSSNAVNNDLSGFTGHLNDSATGLTYMQARYYDPAIGRFLSIDPVTASEHITSVQGTQGFNRYAYVNNNPINGTDPDGQIANFIAGAIIGAAVDLAFQALNVANGGEFSLTQFAASTAAGAITSGGSAIIATSGVSFARQVVTTAALGGTANAGTAVVANAINGEATLPTNAATAFLAGALGAAGGSTIANRSTGSQSALSRAITQGIDETTNVGSTAGNTAAAKAAKAANRAGRISAVGQSIGDALLETGSKIVNNVLDDVIEE